MFPSIDASEVVRLEAAANSKNTYHAMSVTLCARGGILETSFAEQVVMTVDCDTHRVICDIPNLVPYAHSYHGSYS